MTNKSVFNRIRAKRISIVEESDDRKIEIWGID